MKQHSQSHLFNDQLQNLREAVLTRQPGDYMVVDFDETLFLRNSTECFLDHIRPHWWAAWCVFFVDKAKIWWLLALLFGTPRHRAAFVWRDWVRVMTAIIMAPFSLRQWRNQGATRAARLYLNPELQKLINSRPDLKWIISSHGFKPLIEPILRLWEKEALLKGQTFSLVSSSLQQGWRQRQDGKWLRLHEEQTLDKNRLEQALIITDHADHDFDIITQVKEAHVINWPDAIYQPAFARAYWPFRYTLKGKHTFHNHVIRVFIGQDGLALALACALPVIAYSWSGFFFNLLACLFLTLSFFIIYDLGYHENDALGARREKKPILTDERIDNFNTVAWVPAWLLATLCGALAQTCLVASTAWPQSASLTNTSSFTPYLYLASWLAYLGFFRLVFAVFNRVNEISRIPIHLVLQFGKGIGIATWAGFTLSIAGVALLLSFAISRWIPYVIYRLAGPRWETPDRFYRVLLYTIFLVSMIPFATFNFYTLIEVFFIYVLLLLIARKEIPEYFRNFTLLEDKKQDNLHLKDNDPYFDRIKNKVS